MLQRSLPIFLLPVSILAQGVDIRGTVSDSSSGEKLPFASVAISATTRGASSNINGFYLIASVPPGVYDVSASSIGYERRTVRVNVSGREPIVLNFKLAPKPVEFSEVVVTDRAKRELTEINTSVHVLEQRDIHMVPVTVQEDIFRVIQILPGVVSTSDVNSHFYVRGGGGDQNLILLDGMKIFNPYHALGIFSIFDSDIIKTTEVYTGAFPPGYGGRLSSVVNLTTRDGRATGFSGKGSINFVSSKVLLEGPLSSGGRLLVNVRKSLFTRPLSRFLKKDVPLSFYDVFAKATREAEDSHSRYGFEGFYSGDDLNSDKADEADYSWRNRSTAFIASGLIENRVFIDAVGYQNFFEARRNAKASGLTDALTSVSEVGVRANATLYTDSRDLYMFGFEFNFPNLQYNLKNNFGVPVNHENSLVETWAWLRYQSTLGSLQLDGGIHVDVGSLFTRPTGFEAVQPRLNLSYQIGDGWRLKGSFGRYNQNIITVNNEDDVISIFDAWIEVPENLHSEQSDHYVAGLEGNLIPELSLNLQSYYKKYGSLVSYNRDKVDAQDPDYINSIGEAYGFETLLRYGVPFIDIYTAYTISWTTITASGFTYSPKYDRRHTLNALTVFHLADNLDLSLRWEVGSGFPYSQTVGYYDRLTFSDVFRNPQFGETGNPFIRLGTKNSSRLPTYHRLDASLNYRFSLGFINGTLGAHIVNVYDQKNIFYFDRKTGQQINMLPFFPSATLSLEY